MEKVNIDVLLEEQIPQYCNLLQDSARNLQDVANYCEQNYIRAENKREALDETRSFAVQSLASVAYQLNMLASYFLQAVDLEAASLEALDAAINNSAQAVSVHREKVARREIAALTTNKPLTRIQGSKNGTVILESAPDSRRGKYIRRAIDYSLLDSIGHGVRDPGAAQPIYAAGSSGQSAIYAPGSSQSAIYAPGAQQAVYAAGASIDSASSGGSRRVSGMNPPSVARKPSLQANSASAAPTQRPPSPTQARYAGGTLGRTSGSQYGRPSVVAPVYAPGPGASAVSPQSQYGPVGGQPTSQYGPVGQAASQPSSASAGLTQPNFAAAGQQLGRSVSVVAAQRQISDESAASVSHFDMLPPPSSNNPDAESVASASVRGASPPLPPPPDAGSSHAAPDDLLVTGWNTPAQQMRGMQSASTLGGAGVLPPPNFGADAIANPALNVAAARASYMMMQTGVQQQPGMGMPMSMAPGGSQMNASGWRGRGDSDPDWAPDAYLEKVVAVYDYSKMNDDELTFAEGTLIFVVKKNEDGWWEGVMDTGARGLFPSNYVEASY